MLRLPGLHHALFRLTVGKVVSGPNGAEFTSPSVFPLLIQPAT